jgi:hypothetical protein
MRDVQNAERQQYLLLIPGNTRTPHKPLSMRALRPPSHCQLKLYGSGYKPLRLPTSMSAEDDCLRSSRGLQTACLSPASPTGWTRTEDDKTGFPPAPRAPLALKRNARGGMTEKGHDGCTNKTGFPPAPRAPLVLKRNTRGGMTPQKHPSHWTNMLRGERQPWAQE